MEAVAFIICAACESEKHGGFECSNAFPKLYTGGGEMLEDLETSTRRQLELTSTKTFPLRLVRALPRAVQQHIQLGMSNSTTYQEVKDRLVVYERVSISWTRGKILAECGANPIGAVTSYGGGNENEPTPMEVNLVQKGKGKKGKSNDKGKGKNKGQYNNTKGKGKNNDSGKGKGNPASFALCMDLTLHALGAGPANVQTLWTPLGPYHCADAASCPRARCSTPCHCEDAADAQSLAADASSGTPCHCADGADTVWAF
eukprot:s5094_g5.t1